MITSSPGFTNTMTVLQTDCLAPFAQEIWPAVYSSPFSFFNLATIALRNAGYFDVRKFKETPQNAGVKCIALMCSVADQGVLRNYDESLTIYDDADTIREKLNRLLNVPGEETEEELAGQEVLSSREKEIITCVVKGMTNKEIADALYLSAHTVITHRRNIARKLQIHSPAGLTIYAIVNKLVELQDIKEYL